MQVEAHDGFEETSSMKRKAPRRQGTDAALEQVIKRSKKGVKIKVVSGGIIFRKKLLFFL